MQVKGRLVSDEPLGVCLRVGFTKGRVGTKLRPKNSKAVEQRQRQHSPRSDEAVLVRVKAQGIARRREPYGNNDSTT